jgi:hypothetical protein
MSADEQTLVDMEDLLDNLDPETWHESYNIHKLVAHTMCMAAALLREQQAEIERFKVAREEEVRERVAERDSLRRDLEAARVDAERYRWLRDCAEIVEITTSEDPLYFEDGAMWIDSERHETKAEKDAAIDLARARREGT